MSPRCCCVARCCIRNRLLAAAPKSANLCSGLRRNVGVDSETSCMDEGRMGALGRRWASATSFAVMIGMANACPELPLPPPDDEAEVTPGTLPLPPLLPLRA